MSGTKGLKRAENDSQTGRPIFVKNDQLIATKAMLVIFFDYQGVVLKEWIPQSQTVTQHVCLRVLRNLRNSIRRKTPKRRRKPELIIHHDNAPAHKTLKVTEFLVKTLTSTQTCKHPPYSSDLAPNNIFLFPKL